MSGPNISDEVSRPRFKIPKSPALSVGSLRGIQTGAIEDENGTASHGFPHPADTRIPISLAARGSSLGSLREDVEPRAESAEQETPLTTHNAPYTMHSCRESGARLETMRGGKHKGYASIVFQFSKRVAFEGPLIKRNEIRLKLNDVNSGLRLFRKYRTIDSWVRLEKRGEDLDVMIGVPENFQKVDTFLMKAPDRLVVNLFYEDGGDIQGPDEGALPTVKDVQSAEGTPKYGSGPMDKKESVKRGAQNGKSHTLLALGQASRREMDLIKARILSRQGFYEKSLQIYHDLRRRYPGDEEIWTDYIETLVNNAHYEVALDEIVRLLQKNPSNLRAQRIQARIYYEVGLFDWTYPVYENILRFYRRDAGIWSDYALVRESSGQWSRALDYYCKVLELDPENRGALRSVHAILREHRPRFETDYMPHTQESDRSHINIFSTRYAQYLTQRTKIDIDYRRISAYRPKQPGLFSVDRHIRDFTLRLSHRFGSRWNARLGGGFYSGIGGGTSFSLGLGYVFPGRGEIRADYAHNRPWYDPVEAAELDGSFNLASLALNWNFGPAWGVYLGVEEGNYFALVPDDVKAGGALNRKTAFNVGKFGKKRAFTGILTRKISDRPGLYASYAYYRSRFFFKYADYRPIPMLESEEIHSLSFDLEHWPCTYLGYSLSGGFRRHTVRNVNSWYALPRIKIRLGNRILATMSYEYSTESETAFGGKTETLYAGIEVIL